MKKEATVHRLPTENVSCIAFHKLKDEEPGLFYSDKPSVEEAFDNQHLYVTKDEEIKKGDWFLDSTMVPKNNLDDLEYELFGKIIATTDPKLIADEIVGQCDCYCHKGGNVMHIMACCHPKVVKGVAQIPQSFIEEYCKQGGVDEVLVEYEEWTTMYRGMGNYILKTDSNNCIIIHPVEEKVYSREEIENLMGLGYELGKQGGSLTDLKNLTEKL